MAHKNAWRTTASTPLPQLQQNNMNLTLGIIHRPTEQMERIQMAAFRLLSLSQRGPAMTAHGSLDPINKKSSS
jgi:hypothetical protein